MDLDLCFAYVVVCMASRGLSDMTLFYALLGRAGTQHGVYINGGGGGLGKEL